MTTVLTSSLRDDLRARYGAELSMATIDQVLAKNAAHAAGMATVFRTIFVEKDTVAELEQLVAASAEHATQTALAA
ncbi:hypothetical protein CATYP_09970 [Corynebacterium atypicum]|uniref:Amidase n=1 Tax=Corynebacterium atypicum TaxID=191610 RepID=A0ABM5QPN1_9CORY|nr:hypothetical protein [Corynebacterium atypicum]AIG64820.1 hypothetical protein CATYP_09970 [Corynebacterium atypicum]